MVGKFKGKEPLGRPRHKTVDDIKMDVKETGLENTNWINLAQDKGKWRALVRAVTNIPVLYYEWNLLMCSGLIILLLCHELCSVYLVIWLVG
jgi:hypothetical protein